MKQITIMLSRPQHQAYKIAAGNYSGVSEWSRTILEYALLKFYPQYVTPSFEETGLVVTKRVPSNLKRQLIREIQPRTQRVTILIPHSLYKALKQAALRSNIKVAVFCTLILDCECGISMLRQYLSEVPSL